MSGPPVVAIDGPAGSGKSTVSRGVAAELGLRVLDTGAMYRAVTLAVLRAGADPNDGARAATLARDVSLTVEVGERGTVVELDGEDVSAEIRGPEVTATVSVVSAHPPLRRVLAARQREWVHTHEGGVVEGRDIGTVVFPDAPIKVFLTASEAERARRRGRDEEAAGRQASVDAVAAELARRDATDSKRVASPLRVAPDAWVLDTTGRTADEVVDDIVREFRARVGASS